jgi:hypothetical protein
MLPGVVRVPESRTEGALKDETTWLVLRPALRAARRVGPRVSTLCVLVAIGGIQSGCSAISATLECRDAARAVERGVASGPQGIYQLTLARAYLEKAREEAAEAHYGSAVSLAHAAQLATERARDGATQHRVQGRLE